MRIRLMKLRDYEAVIALWQRAGLSHEPQARDSQEAVKKQLQQSGHLMFVAEADGEIIGTIFASHDGRKGWINRLAVEPRLRHRGLAQRLIETAEETLQRAGLTIVAALIEAPNEPSRALFHKLGYQERLDVVYYRKFLKKG